MMRMEESLSMEFTTLTEEEFRKFYLAHPLKTFLQSPEIGMLRVKSGWQVDYVGVKKKDTIIAATMLLSKPQFLHKLEFYAPRGFLLDYNDKKLLKFFTEQIRKFIQKRHGYILRIDPYLVKQERDINGDIVENGENNEDVISTLKKLGFQESKHHEQVKWMFVLNLENKTEEQLMKEFRPNTRNYIRKAMKLGIQVRELSYDELDVFKAITKETSSRIGFPDKSLKYYQDMYKLLHDKGEIRYMIAELNLKEYQAKTLEEIESLKTQIEEIGDNHSKQGRKKSLTIDLENAKKRVKETEKLIKAHGDSIVLSGGMFICNCEEMIYLFSGNYIEFMQFNGQYLIQWEMIRYALNNGFKKYNFYGISGNFDKKSSEYGVYEFKKGFNGHVVELIGEFELPINHYYNLYKNNIAIRNTIKKIIKK